MIIFKPGMRVEVLRRKVPFARATVLNFDPEDDHYELLYDGETEPVWTSAILRKLSLLEVLAEAARDDEVPQ